jgi:hypothetical protein
LSALKATFRQGRYPSADAEWSKLMDGIDPEVVIDTLAGDVFGLHRAVKRTCRHLIVCGPAWMLGEPKTLPTPPVAQTPCEFVGYARRLRILPRKVAGIPQQQTW